MEMIARKNRLYNASLVKLLRACILLGLVAFIFVSGINNIAIVKFPLSLLSLFFMNEIFFHFALRKSLPEKTISQADQNQADKTVTLAATEVLLSGNIHDILQTLKTKPQIQFFLQKTEIALSELPEVSLERNILLADAYLVAKTRKGDYITTIDILVAYLLATENQTKLLLTKKLKKEDIPEIAYWTLHTYPFEEHPQKTRVTFWGEGIGYAMVTGWTNETQQFTKELQIHNQYVYLSGREHEFQEMLEALTKQENNNILLVGEQGVGRDTLAEAFATKSFLGTLENNLNHKKLLELLINALLAGTDTAGSLEERLQAIIEEVSHAENVILYIPELQNALGATSVGLDISGILLPYLHTGKLPIIATMTPANYKLFMEKNPLKEVFTPIMLTEPEESTALRMVLDKTREIERGNHIAIAYSAIVAAVHDAKRYMQDAYLPGSAITLLEDAAAAVAHDITRKQKLLIGDDITKRIEATTHVKVGLPTQEEKTTLMNLETLLHQQVIGQDEGISQIAEAVRRVRSGLATPTKPISFLFLGPTGVGKTETAKALARIYFGGEDHMIRLDMSEYASAEGMARLLGAAPGEGTQRGELTEKVHDNPFSLILLDEFEKAYPDILNLFLQVLEDGRLTDNQGKTVSFVNTIIIATSNAGSELIREQVAKGQRIDKTFQAALTNMLEQQAVFKPELLNRFDAIVAFQPLNQQQLSTIVQLLLQGTTQRLMQQDITVVFDPSVVQLVVQEGFDPQFGARPFRRFIQDKIEDILAKQILSGTIQRGAHLFVTIAPDKTILVKQQ